MRTIAVLALALAACADPTPTAVAVAPITEHDSPVPTLDQLFGETHTFTVTELRDEVALAQIETTAGTLLLELQAPDQPLEIGQEVTLAFDQLTYTGRADVCNADNTDLEDVDVKIETAELGAYPTGKPNSYCGTRTVMAMGPTITGIAIVVGMGIIVAGAAFPRCPLINGPWCKGPCIANLFGLPWPGVCRGRFWFLCSCRPIIIFFPIPICPPFFPKAVGTAD